MNDVEIDIKDRTITFGNFIRFYDVPEYIINYINQLQSNWNSLREYIGKEWYCFDNESVEFEVAKNILDKMNELEGKDKE